MARVPAARAGGVRRSLRADPVPGCEFSDRDGWPFGAASALYYMFAYRRGEMRYVMDAFEKMMDANSGLRGSKKCLRGSVGAKKIFEIRGAGSRPRRAGRAAPCGAELRRRQMRGN